MSIPLIGGLRCPVDSMDEKPYDLFYFPLIVEVTLRPRLGMPPDTHPHGKPFGQFKDILVRFIVTHKEYAGLPEVNHQGQHCRSFPTFPLMQHIHRRFPKNQAQDRREVIEQEEKSNTRSGGLIGPSQVLATQIISFPLRKHPNLGGSCPGNGTIDPHHSRSILLGLARRERFFAQFFHFALSTAW